MKQQLAFKLRHLLWSQPRKMQYGTDGVVCPPCCTGMADSWPVETKLTVTLKSIMAISAKSRSFSVNMTGKSFMPRKAQSPPGPPQPGAAKA
jgi:hypothetical protein